MRFPRLPKRNGGILLRVERAWEGGERPTSKGDENEGRKEGTEREGKGIHRKVKVSRISTVWLCCNVYVNSLARV